MAKVGGPGDGRSAAAAKRTILAAPQPRVHPSPRDDIKESPPGVSLLAFLAVSGTILALAYRYLGSWLARTFALSGTPDTPAHTMRDGLDFEPTPAPRLFPQHLSAIAAAGPIVGPILAAIHFGWGPAWLWVIVGSILIGGIHDFTALVASVRHGARSVAAIVREYMNPRAHLLFLLFIWFALIYVIIAFTDVTASTFVAKASVEGGDAPGPAVATSSLLYLLLAVAMGFCQRHLGMGDGAARAVFLPLVLVAIVAGPWIPIAMPAAVGPLTGQQAWGLVLLAYCFVAALAPLWALLKPRGELGGYFLYAVMAVALAGIAAGALRGTLAIEAPFFRGWTGRNAAGDTLPLFPILFITVACGACSGFHAIIASGTTSKQLCCEAEARPVAYGSMLLEAFLACVSLATVMILADPKGVPNTLFAAGVSRFGAEAAAPFAGDSPHLRAMLMQFALLCFATFVFDTLDACTRLARYILMELMGWSTRPQAVAATAICVALPLVAVCLPPLMVDGRPLPLWQIFWNIFGASNQLLAALTLLGVTVWLARRGLPAWIAFWPMLFMVVMTIWSLVLMLGPYLALWEAGAPIALVRHLQFGIVLSLIILAAWLVVEALLTLRSMGGAEPVADGAIASPR